MKRTKKPTGHTELMCEMSREEFEHISAIAAAKLIVEIMGDEPDVKDFAMGLAMTKLFAKLGTRIADAMFGDDTNDNNDKEEEQ